MAKVVFDHGWSWMVLFQACFTSLINDGFRMSLGIFYSQFLDTMNLSQPRAAMIIAVLNGMFMLPGPIAIFLKQKIGARATVIFGAFLTSMGLISSSFCYSFWPLLFSFGFVVGLGCCFKFVALLSVLPCWFEKYRQLGPALVMACGGFGIFVMAPLVQLLIETYSWRGAVIVLAGFTLQAVISGCTLFPVPPPANAVHKKHSDIRLICTNLSLWLHLVAAFFMFGMPLFFIFIVRHVTEYRGFTPQEAAFLVSICGITSFAGRFSIVLSLLLKKSATKNVRFILYNFSGLFGAVCSGLIAYLWRYSAVAIICGIMGFMQGVRLGSMVGVTMDITGPRLFQTAYGYFHFTGGLAMVVIPPIAGFLSQTFRSYDSVFYMSASALLLSFIIGSIVHLLEIRKDRKHRKPSESSALKSSNN